MRAASFSFSAGEVSPEIAARMDVAKYGSALALARNVIGLREGGVRNRPGFQFVGQVRNSADPVRLIPFQFSTDQAYALEFAWEKVRIIRDAAYVARDPVTITSLESPFVVGIPGHNLVRNQHVFIQDVGGLLGADGLSGVNGRTFRVDPDPDYHPEVDPNQVRLVQLDGKPLDIAALSPWTGPGVTPGHAKAIVEVDSPFTAAELSELRYEQSADVMYLAHPAHPLQRLQRQAAEGGNDDQAEWSIEPVDFKSHVNPPKAVQATAVTGPGSASPIDHVYRVSSFNDETGQESLISDASPPRPNDLTLVGSYNTVWWQAPDPVDGADPPTRYVVYKASNGLYGYIGSTEPSGSTVGPDDGADTGSGGTGGGGGGGVGGGGPPIITAAEPTAPPVTWFSFKDDNIDPDLGSGPQIDADPLSGEHNYADAIGFYEQRLFLAGTDAKPNGVWGSRSGDFQNMNYSRPLRADDGMSFGISARQVNRVLHLVPMSDLLAFTSESVFKVSGVGGDPIGPSSISVKPQVHRGSAACRPLVIDEAVLYVTAKGSKLRNLGYQFASDGWQGTDLTVMSSHLFRGRRIVETAWVEYPHSAVFCLLDDGALLCLTWMPEQEVTGWSRLETDGAVQSICAVTENGRDSLYAVVQRRRGTGPGPGLWRFVERLALPYERDAWRPPATQAELALPAACRCEAGDDCIRHACYLDAAVSYCGEPARLFSGLEHLEARTVSVLADGDVVHGLSVANGRVTLPAPASCVTVGLPYTATIRTLPVVLQNGAGKRQGAARAVVRLLDSRGMRVGVDPARLEPPKPRLDAGWDQASDLVSGDCEVVFDAAWSSDLGITVQQSEPLPMTVLGVYPDVQAGG